MRIFSKQKSLSTVLIVGLGCITYPDHSGAVLPVTCDNCSTLWDQITTNLKLAQQYATQLQQYQNQLQSYALLIRNTTALPYSIWTQVENDIMQVRSLSNAANLLAGNSGTIINRLNSATSYQVPSLTSYGNQLTMWRTDIGNSLNSLGKAIGIQQGQVQSDTATSMAIQAASNSAIGQLQAIQAGNDMAAANNKALMQIQQTLVNTAQMQGTVISAKADQDAMTDAAIENFVKPVPVGSAAKAW